MFHIATESEIKKGKTSDVYFSRAIAALKSAKLDKHIKAEIRTNSLPLEWQWAVLAGIEEAAHFLEGLKISVSSMEEGTIFEAMTPVLLIEGSYLEFAVAETPLLGFLCQASGIATKAARCRKAAGGRQIISFGARRMHPAIAPMIERSAFIGGCDGVAGIKSAELIGEVPVGTMPHSLVLLTGDVTEAFKLLDRTAPSEVKRVAIIDTFADEKFEAIRIARAAGKKLFAVRLDTPISRRGDMKQILGEVRWELDLRGFSNVKLFVSGGIDEDEIERLNPLVDAYGIGTALSNAPTINFSLDIVEIEGEPVSKRGKESGAKEVLRCESCHKTIIIPMGREKTKCRCGGRYYYLLKSLIKNGEVVSKLPSARKIREHVMKQLEKVVSRE
ncbi:nicotinate phosphoribosyltransferase [candidate division NPL-UPA2 bacterium Unc8]|uniref:nicotinate phosphoribosyltransferase n=1 Tax=candidate division NPL-UPA2 bacterium Unc8 TaxID=1980939 RepID=A0A399FZU9_UNCN2|nr:Nicotinate phosphoribosyltransferase pncB1 [Bacillota bacterium]RII00996.1 MAG: nicotinate phosphoribosyltransferase [candidate division NPL-UPA2 bacterium Unc8]